MLGERIREAGDPREGGRRRADENQHARDSDGDFERIDDYSRQQAVERGGDSDERQLEPLLSERSLSVGHRIGREPDRADQDRHDDHQPDRGEERPRKRPARLRRLLREVGNRLESRVGEHRERQGKREVAPVLAAFECEAVHQRRGRQQEGEPEEHEHALHDEVEQRDDERSDVESRSADDPDACDDDDDAAADERVPRRLSQRRCAESAGDVVRDEEGGERHHDEEVEEEHPAGHEAGQIVERTSNEGRSASRLRQGGRAFCIGQRHEDEDAARDEQDERRQAERRAGHDAERDVQRGCDLAVRDREERRRVEHPLEAPELARHQRSL